MSGTGQDVIALAEELAAEFSELAAEVDRDGRFPARELRPAQGLRVPGAAHPRGARREGRGPRHRVPGPVDPGRGCASTALAVNMHLFGLGAAAESLHDGEEDARMVLQLAASGVLIGGSFTDAATGLNVRASSTPAERVDGGYKVHGRKAFCSLAPALDVFYGTAGLTDGSGLLLFAIGRDAPGLSFVDTWDTMSIRGTGSWDVIFDDVFVPEFMAQVGTPWDEWNKRSERMLAWFACTVASVYLGIAESAAAFASSYLANRKLGGMDLPLSRQPGIIFNAGDVDALIRPARALLNETIRRRESELLPAHEVIAAKYCVTNAAVAAVERCFRMVGGSGLYRRLPMERMFRDVQAGPLHPPSNDLALEGLGRAALGIPPDALPRWGN